MGYKKDDLAAAEKLRCNCCRKLRHLPSLPPSLLGPLEVMRDRTDRHRLYVEWAQKYGPIMTYRILTTHVSQP